MNTTPIAAAHRAPSDPGAQTPTVRVTNVTKSFKTGPGATIHAVRQVSFNIHHGEIVAILGPNGAGKTTLIDMLLGLSDPTDGTVEVFGQAPRRAVVDGRVAAVLQSGGLLADLSIRETVRMIASTYSQHSGVDNVIERAGLAKIAARRVAKCSGGEQQRLRFALALLPEPDLLYLDEPTAAMDVGARQEFWSTMRDEAARGKTIVFATHYLQEVEDFAQRAIMISRGQIVADGLTVDLRRQFGSRCVTAKLDDSRMADAVADIRRLPAPAAVTATHAAIRVVTEASDDVARLLLNDYAAHDLQITGGSLETAFMELTEATNS